LVTYQGAEVIKRRQMDWNACNVLEFYGFDDPQIWMP